MKILFVSENYYPNISGVPVVVQYLAEELVRRGNDVAVLTREMDNAKGDENLNGVKIFRIHVYYDILKFYKGEIDRFVNFVRMYKADVIVLEGASVITTDILLPHLKNISGIKILHSHGFSRLLIKPFKKLSTFKNTIGNTYDWIRWRRYFSVTLPRYIKYINGVFCLSRIDSSYEYLKKIYKGNVNVIGNAADEAFFKPSESNVISKYTQEPIKSYFLSVANYMAVKNQIGILEQYYKSGVKDYDMIFIGRERNYYYDALIQRKEELEKDFGHRNVHILNNIDRQDIPSIVEGAKLYLVGSEVEGFSISIIESMAKGVPFISTNVGNARELPGGITVDNINQMHEMLRDLINDNNRWRDLSEEGKQYAYDQCRVKVAVDKLERLITECR